MYENQTYEVILNRMINRVAEKHPKLDRREGSIIFDTLASDAVEHAIMYTEMDNANKESFVPTASREYKFIGCADVGIDTSLFEANAGTFKGEFNVEVELGSRVNCDLHNYVVVEYLGMNGEYHTYAMECETLGTAPNDLRGSLTFITEIPDGLNYAELTECLIEGENELTDEEINIIFKEHVNSESDGGNVNQYKTWCAEYDGIGNYKILPLWDGPNTVKVSILSASNRAASDELIEKFQEYMDPNVTGMGDGVAPIGAFVTVTTATEIPIDIRARVTMKTGYNDTTAIDAALENYFKSMSYVKSQVAYMNIGAEILNVEGVEAVRDLVVNEDTYDVPLSDEEIPILGTTSWTVV